MNKFFFYLNNKNNKNNKLNNNNSSQLNSSNSIISIIVGCLTGFFNGLFGSGGGAILVPCLEKFLGLEEHKAHATAISITLPVSIVSIFIYSKNTVLDFNTIIYVSLGGVIGAYFGAKYLKKIPSRWLHKIFGIFMLIGAWRMIL